MFIAYIPGKNCFLSSSSLVIHHLKENTAIEELWATVLGFEGLLLHISNMIHTENIMFAPCLQVKNMIYFLQGCGDKDGDYAQPVPSLSNILIHDF